MNQDQINELAELMTKVAPEAGKIPGLEKKVDAMQTLIDGLKKSADSSKEKPEETKVEGRKIAAPEVALAHYANCDTCKPKLAKWLADNGY
jgi:hypothetical protein